MKIFLRQIPEGGHTFQEVMTAKGLGLPEDFFMCLSPLVVEAQFQRAGDELLGKVKVSGWYRQICCRCADEIESEKTDHFDLIYDIEPGMDFIDCDDDIRQELILAAVPNPVCHEGCKGLCLRCGVNLNSEQCHCKVVDS